MHCCTYWWVTLELNPYFYTVCVRVCVRTQMSKEANNMQFKEYTHINNNSLHLCNMNAFWSFNFIVNTQFLLHSQHTWLLYGICLKRGGGPAKCYPVLHSLSSPQHSSHSASPITLKEKQNKKLKKESTKHLCRLLVILSHSISPSSNPVFNLTWYLGLPTTTTTTPLTVHWQIQF